MSGWSQFVPELKVRSCRSNRLLECALANGKADILVHTDGCCRQCRRKWRTKSVEELSHSKPFTERGSCSQAERHGSKREGRDAKHGTRNLAAAKGNWTMVPRAICRRVIGVSRLQQERDNVDANSSNSSAACEANFHSSTGFTGKYFPYSLVSGP